LKLGGAATREYRRRAAQELPDTADPGWSQHLQEMSRKRLDASDRLRQVLDKAWVEWRQWIALEDVGVLVGGRGKPKRLAASAGW